MSNQRLIHSETKSELIQQIFAAILCRSSSARLSYFDKDIKIKIEQNYNFARCCVWVSNSVSHGEDRTQKFKLSRGRADRRICV